MKFNRALNITLALIINFLCFPLVIYSQSTNPDVNSTNSLLSNDQLFENESIIDITLSGNVAEALADRGDDPQYHSMLLSYINNDKADSMQIRVKARGHFRRAKGTCLYPPLWLNFDQENTPQSSVFYGQDKIKLVTPCQGDQYVVREYLVYKIFNLVTDKSFRDRLVQITFKDTVKNTTTRPMFGMLLESEDKMAERNHSISLDRQKVLPQNTQKQDFLNMAVFEYLIGNTDWSVRYLQNIKLLYTDTTGAPVTVPYDFDHAGIVNAPYAEPAPELKLTSVRERRYRGYCIDDMNEFKEAFDLYNKLKPDIYKIYQNCTYISDKYKHSTIKFLDNFYKVINDPKKSSKEFTYPCSPYGTGNVVIKGLRED